MTPQKIEVRRSTSHLWRADFGYVEFKDGCVIGYSGSELLFAYKLLPGEYLMMKKQPDGMLAEINQ